jgi:hypothetical protein
MNNITCPFCKTINRLSKAAPKGSKPICGSCKQDLTTSPSKKGKSFFQPRFIIFAICVALWFFQNSKMDGINVQAAPIAAEMNEMNSGGYLTSAVIESFLRGAMGDPFGKAHEESDKETSLRAAMAPLAYEYQGAEGVRDLAFWIGLITLCWIGIKRWKRKRASA